jgi:hypothetical protein
MILSDAFSVEFQSNELLDLSLNARLALGITEKETHPVKILDEDEARRQVGKRIGAYPGYPVGRLGAGMLSCWPVTVELADGWSMTMFSDFQGLRCGPELTEPFWACRVIRCGSWVAAGGGEPLRMRDSRVLKEGRVTGLEGRGSKGGSCPGDS